ncbi:replication protein P [Basfia succiniciproducens]|uniref:replication protein P n=1 Tax=Basfia succiniciproducens TaxID=653940 RepID=UPI0008B5D729|nr:replication protein P [Basfia succiniciproducens]SEQ74118.1 phage replication protein P [Basfia succiniciproducens]
MNQVMNIQRVAENKNTQSASMVERLINRVFEQLIASCPILLTIQPEQLKIIKQQWVLGFIEGGVTTFEQVKRGMAAVRAKSNGYLPSVGEFISWCKSGNEYAHLGLPSADDLAKRVKAFMGYGFELEDQFTFVSDLEYWLITDAYRKCKVNRWNDKQFDAGLKEVLSAWADRLSHGEKIPERRRQIPKTVKITTTLEQDLNYLAKMKAMLKGKRLGATA